MTSQPDQEWWHAQPAYETWVPCGADMHPVRWEDGRLNLPAHPDAEGELVFAALGGDKPGCVDLAEAWHRHAGDLDVLMIGPRGPADDIRVNWDDVRAFRSGRPTGWVARQPIGGSVTWSARTRPSSQPMRRPARPVTPLPPGRRGTILGGGSPGADAEAERLRSDRLDMLSLLALGPAFQMLLSGAVAAAWSDGGPRAGQRPRHRPELEAALTGRLGPAAAGWLGIEPGQVDGRLHEGAGWGSLELTGTGGARHLRAALPAGWLAAVWACGLTVTGGHLVVAVEHAAWPDATVLAVPEPGQDPVLLSVRASEDAGPDADQDAGPSGDRAHWEVTGVRPAAPAMPDEPAGSSRGEADRP
jgi:hypothetical protein